MSATHGKVALVENQTTLVVANPAGGAGIADFVGYGTATAYEGSGPAPAPSATTAIFRANGGATDTDDNSADFTTGTPAPRNSSTGPSAPDLAIISFAFGQFCPGRYRRHLHHHCDECRRRGLQRDRHCADTLPPA